MIILKNDSSLLDKDLSPAYAAIHTIKDNELTAMFKKKEPIEKMSKSILKHRIQTLTNKNIQQIQEEMKYKPVDPNETGMNHDILKKLAHCLIMLAEGQLGNVQSNGATNEAEATKPLNTTVGKSPGKVAAKKRTADDMSPVSEAPSSKKGRRSISTLSQLKSDTDLVDSPRGGRGRKSMVPAIMTQSNGFGTPRASRRTPAAATSSLDTSSSTEASVAVRCMGPANGDKLTNLEEEQENEIEGISNPTPAMKELLKKRRSIASTNKSSASKKSPVKRASEQVATPTIQPAETTIEEPAAVEPIPAKEMRKSAAAASAVKVKKAASPVKKKKVTCPPRVEFIGANNTRSYLIAGDPLQLRIESVARIIPLSIKFPGAHLAIVHTPHDWTPVDLHRMALAIKNLNLSAGLDTFVILAGTGFKNLKMNSEALEQITKHVQFITFHREDANKDEPPNGKLREITTLFLVAYVFPGCDKEGSVLPHQMVNDGYTNCFRCKDVTQLEYSILDCFSEEGDWLLDVNCEKRKLTLAAQEQGRNSIAISPLKEDLEDLGNYLRTQSLKNDDTYRKLH